MRRITNPELSVPDVNQPLTERQLKDLSRLTMYAYHGVDSFGSRIEEIEEHCSVWRSKDYTDGVPGLGGIQEAEADDLAGKMVRISLMYKDLARPSLSKSFFRDVPRQILPASVGAAVGAGIADVLVDSAGSTTLAVGAIAGLAIGSIPGIIYDKNVKNTTDGLIADYSKHLFRYTEIEGPIYNQHFIENVGDYGSHIARSVANRHNINLQS